MTGRPVTDRCDAGPLDLSSTPIHLESRPGSGNTAQAIANFGFDGPSFEAYIEKYCDTDAPGRLVMVETTPSDWRLWECHTKGDEVVIVLEGKALFIQEIDGEERGFEVGPGSTVINPAGVWHTANVEQPMKAIYITPCPGTQHRER
jgi:mannose-6-phosphate isomerase-like protein (cupin superfamily)